MEAKQLLFPFTRIVGQEEMKRALLLNIIDPSIGGVLIKGEKGHGQINNGEVFGADSARA